MVQKYKIIENVLALQKNGETIGDNKMNIKQLIRTIYRLVFFRQRASSAYFGRIRTLIPATSGQRFGIIRTA